MSSTKLPVVATAQSSVSPPASEPIAAVTKSSWSEFAAEALRIDFKARVSVKSRLASLSSLSCEDAESVDGIGNGCRSKDRLLCSIGFGNKVTESEVQQRYKNTVLEDRWKDVVLVIKLALSLLSYGQVSVDAQIVLLNVCATLELPSPEIELGTSSILMSFGGCAAHFLHFKPDIVADKLLDITTLSTELVCDKEIDSQVALMLLDEINVRPLPYGWLVHLLNLQCLFSWAAIAAFMGDFHDMAATAMIAPFVILIMQVCKRFNLGNIELVLASIVAGIVTPIVWRYVIPLSTCHVPRLWASALLIYLPGTELINGAYEIKYGNINNGATQLVNALVKCAFMGAGLTLGWQVFGYNAAVAEVNGVHGAKASLVPAEMCPGFGIPWEIIFTFYNFPMLFHCFLSLNIRLRDIWKAFIVVYPSLLVFIALLMRSGLPGFVVDILGLFIATNLASLMEYKTGTSVNISVVPMIIILAPGAPSVMSVLQSMQKDGGIAGERVTAFWNNLALQGVSYAVGLCLALEMWRPFVQRKMKGRAEAYGL